MPSALFTSKKTPFVRSNTSYYRCVLTKIKSTPVVQNALTSPASVHGSPRGNSLTLPKSIESGNLSHNEAVIWWMPAICDFLQLFWSALE
jgi:hypothetical protein